MVFRSEQCDFGVSGRVLCSPESDRDQFGFYEKFEWIFFGGDIGIYIFIS